MSAEPVIAPAENELGISIEDMYRLTVRQYHAIADAAILDEDDPVELLGGWLNRKMTQKPAHPITADLVVKTGAC